MHTYTHTQSSLSGDQLSGSSASVEEAAGQTSQSLSQAHFGAGTDTGSIIALALIVQFIFVFHIFQAICLLSY